MHVTANLDHDCKAKGADEIKSRQSCRLYSLGLATSDLELSRNAHYALRSKFKILINTAPALA